MCCERSAVWIDRFNKQSLSLIVAKIKYIFRFCNYNLNFFYYNNKFPRIKWKWSQFVQKLHEGIMRKINTIFRL